MSIEKHRMRIYFVSEEVIRQAVIVMQHYYGFGFSWIRSCDYLKEDRKFAVQVIFSAPYPYLENEFEKWEKPAPTIPHEGVKDV